jgi:hypothetical protein
VAVKVVIDVVTVPLGLAALVVPWRGPWAVAHYMGKFEWCDDGRYW